MCGICGVVCLDQSRPIDEQQLMRMRDSMFLRGPDDAGLYVGVGVGLAARRLAIFDLSERGHMPMSTPDGRFWIVFNGAIYNFPELRAQLEGRGWRFRSDTDTEVLLYLYADEGPAMLDRLNGMFAIAVWDARERTLFLARDHMGIKPLYYTANRAALRFASEPKALFAGGVERRFDPNTWEELLCFRYTAGERTPFVSVKRLLPGHYLIWRRGAAQIRRWWHLGERARALRETLPADPAEWFRATFDDAVRLRRMADVPVGVLLSGGLDSSSITASLAEEPGERPISSFTVRFEHTAYDEGPLARQVAARYRLNYHEAQIAPHEMPALLRRAAWLNDEPLAHANDLHLLAVAQVAKPLVTVLLSGEGADETLGGYIRYRPLRYPALLRAARVALPGLAPALGTSGRGHKLTRFLKLKSLKQHLLLNSCETLPAELRALDLKPTECFPYREQALAEAEALYAGDLVRQAMYYDQHTFLCSLLDRNDRMMMGASIECRTPFVDRRLVAMLAALPSRVMLKGWQGKPLLRQAVGARLPRAVRRHPKWGFGVPWSPTLRQLPEFSEQLRELHNLAPISDGPLDRTKLKRIVGAFLSGEDRHQELVRQLFMLVLWQQALVSGGGFDVAGLAGAPKGLLTLAG